MFRVLIAEDNKGMRGLLKYLLQEMDCEAISEAHNGIEALQQFKTFRPDITLLDINMPKLDGISVLRTIRASDPEAVVIIISAETRDHIILEAISLGAREYMFKPINVKKFMEIIANIQIQGKLTTGEFAAC